MAVGTLPSPLELLAAARRDDFREMVWVGIAEVPGPDESSRRPTADQDPFTAHANHHVVWLSKLPFSVAFEKARPTQGSHVLESQPLPRELRDELSGAEHFAVARLREDASSVHTYEYTLSVVEDCEGESCLRTADPGGNVDRDPTLA